MTTRTYGAAKPSLEAALEHYGVKGMQWGVRRQEKLHTKGEKLVAKAQNPNNSNRKNKNLQIKIARVNVASRQVEIQRLARMADKAKTPQDRQKYDALATKKATQLFNHPDTLTASRMTTGEKVVNGLLIGTTIAVAGASAAGRAGGGIHNTPRQPYRTTAYVNR